MNMLILAAGKTWGVRRRLPGGDEQEGEPTCDRVPVRIMSLTTELYEFVSSCFVGLCGVERLGLGGLGESEQARPFILLGGGRGVKIVLRSRGR